MFVSFQDVTQLNESEGKCFVIVSNIREEMNNILRLSCVSRVTTSSSVSDMNY